MTWSIQEVARLTGISSRTLRHYDAIGLLPAERDDANDYRRYRYGDLLKLQRILLLRDLGLSLERIGELLRREADPVAALEEHANALATQQEKLARQLRAVRATISSLKEGVTLMAEEIFDGFDNSQYEEEVVERWGREAFNESGRRWAALGKEGRASHLNEHNEIGKAVAAAAARGLKPNDPEVQAVVARHYAWVTHFMEYSPSAYANMGSMYVSDPRFKKTYDDFGEGTAELLATAMAIYAENL